MVLHGTGQPRKVVSCFCTAPARGAPDPPQGLAGAGQAELEGMGFDAGSVQVALQVRPPGVREQRTDTVQSFGRAEECST